VSWDHYTLNLLLTVIVDNLAKMFQETVTIFTEMIKEQQDITAEFMLATDLLKDHQEALATNHSEMIQTSRDALNSIISQIVGTHTDLSRVSLIYCKTLFDTDISAGS